MPHYPNSGSELTTDGSLNGTRERSPSLFCRSSDLLWIASQLPHVLQCSRLKYSRQARGGFNMDFWRIPFAAIGAGLALVLSWSLTPAADEPGLNNKAQVEKGKELFTREWTAGDRRSHAGDGLGPVFNARSCAECHRLGGVGGAGSNETNVSLVTVFVGVVSDGPIAVTGVLAAPPPSLEEARNRVVVDRGSGRKIELEIPSPDELAKIHPALRTQTSFPLHRFGAGTEFTKWKESIFPKGKTETEGFNKQDSNRRHVKSGGSSKLSLIESKRNTPPLFGAGLIDAIPDKVLDEVAAEQARASGDAAKSDEFGMLPIKGRVARLKDGRAGRFGWKASVASLSDFTLQACASELGLEVPGFARAAPPWKSDYKAPGIDLTREQCNSLTLYMASLPKPGIRAAESLKQAGAIKHGRELFEKVGCAACHRPNLGSVEGIYSDLLLHNMGPELSDSGSYTVLEPERASKEKPKETRPANQLEWRTPPLWGLRDSAPYLHDGRAGTLGDAVLFHSGEGWTAARAYRALSKEDREDVDLFLLSLAAP